MINSFLKTVNCRWDHFWYKPTSSINLGLVRFFFFLWAGLYYFNDNHWWVWSTLDQDLWLPVRSLWFLDQPLIQSWKLFRSLEEYIWPSLMLMSAVGLFTRFSTTLATILGFFLLASRLGYGEDSRDALGIIIFSIIFAVSQCGRSFSIDAYLKAKDLVNEKRGGEFQWPIQLMKVVFCAIFFSAGISKLKESGIDWVMSDTLRYGFLFSYYEPELTEFMKSLKIGYATAQYDWLCHLLAGSVLFIEVACPLALFFKKAAQFFVPALAAFLLGIYLFNTDGFNEMWALFFCWIPFQKLIAKVKKTRWATE